MKIIEESKLELNINILEEAKSLANPISFYKQLDTLNMTSLQSISFDSDFAFFDELNFILSVIMSIINHPHLSNKGEEIVLRTDQAGHISVDSFQKVLREPSFWKEKDLEMTPFQVYHYQYTDDVKIYENVFIGLVIKTIAILIDRYQEFYGDLVPSITDDETLLKQDDVERGLSSLASLTRKLSFIKDTYFFKEVSKVPLANKQIRPTNILVKDRLYNYCYRFYKKFIAFFDSYEISLKFRDYYYTLILKDLYHRGYQALKDSCFDNYTLANDLFEINVSKEENQNTILLKIKHLSSNVSSTHRLYTILDRNNNDLTFDNIDVLSVDVITLWNLYYNNDLTKPAFLNLETEKQIVSHYLDSKLTIKNIKQDLFSKYCPVCKHNHLDNDNNLFVCAKCHSTYKFIKDNQVWFLKIGGSHE